MSDTRDGTPEGLGPLTGPDGLTQLTEMVWSFFGQLEHRLGRVRAACENGDHVHLSVLAGHMQGVAPPCGPLVHDLAAEADVHHVREKVEALILTCRRVKRK